MIGILIGIIALVLLWINYQISTVLNEVKKGNKDQQEIKTRLTWMRRAIKNIYDEYDR
jgi:hypothetical protein